MRAQRTRCSPRLRPASRASNGTATSRRCRRRRRRWRESATCLQAYRVGELAWGIQFHAEVTLADAESWIDDFGTDEDAVRAGLDPDAFRASTRARIGAWNELGRELCDRFLEVVAATRA